MARPSQQLDLALLDAGEEEIRLKGVRGLNVRAICARAGVSPRMLNYYFGSKDNFVHTLLSRGYMNFFRDVEESVRGGETPLDCLRRGLRACLRHTVEGRMALRNIICDASAGEPAISEMIRDHSSHTRLMFGLVEEAWRRGDLRKDISPAEIFTAVMPGVFLPALQMDPPFPFSLRHIRALIAEPQEPEGEEGIRLAVERGMRNFECLLQGFLSPQGAADAEPGRDDSRGVRSPRSPRAGRRAHSVKRRFALAQPGQSKPGENTPDHPKTEGPGHIVHHAEQRGKNAE